MPAPSQLSIQTSALQRLVKEEASYHDELQHQEARIAKLEQGGSNDENAEYTLRQERKAAEETKAMFPQLKQKIQDAVARLQAHLEQNQGSGSEDATGDVAKAKDAIAAAQAVTRESS